MDVEGNSERVVYSAPEHFEAPNWSPDGSYLLLNSRGRLWRLPSSGGKPELVPTGTVVNLNNDHGISPDGSLLAISAGPIYTLPATGGEPRRITEKTPSYFHGWSPDGATLAYCAPRDGVFNIYAIPAGGGQETRLTFGAGPDDGPDYSRDGKWIYFNSHRTGSGSIWRIPVTGENSSEGIGAEQITNDDYEDWFPHPSPDGQWLLFLSYPKGTQGHPSGKNVVLRRMPLPGSAGAKSEIRELIQIFGGQGSLNVNSWSPDSKHFAYVRYSINE
jgi:Tol biopolymer transport system component